MQFSWEKGWERGKRDRIFEIGTQFANWHNLLLYEVFILCIVFMIWDVEAERTYEHVEHDVHDRSNDKHNLKVNKDHPAHLSRSLECQFRRRIAHPPFKEIGQYEELEHHQVSLKDHWSDTLCRIAHVSSMSHENA